MTAIREIIEKHDYQEALSVLAWILSFKSEQQKRDHLRAMYNQFLTTARDLPEAKDGDVLFIRSLGREDYAFLFGSIAKVCDHPRKVMLNTFATRSVERNHDAVRFLSDHLDLIDRIRVRNPIDRQCAFLQLMSFGMILERYAALRPDALICFSDMQPIENLFARYFRHKGVPTVTCQHGLYIDYGEYKTINCINYLNHASEHFLAWGDETASLIRAYHPDARVHLCGKPVLHRGKIAPSSKTSKSIQVILDQPIFEAENIAMFRLVSDFAKTAGHTVSVRYHPSINRETFSKKLGSPAEATDFLSADIVVGHTSSLLFEALALGKKVVQFKSAIPTVDLPSQLQFHDMATLRKAAGTKADPALARSYFAHFGDEAKKAYREFFQTLFVGRPANATATPTPLPRVRKTHRWYRALSAEFFVDPLVTQQRLSGRAVAPPSQQGEWQTLSAIVVPCLLSDVENIRQTLEHWCHPALAPSATGRKVKLVLVFNTINDVVRAEVLNAWRDNPRLALFFSELVIRSADLSGDRDLYVKERSRELKGTYGNIAGPNFLFQRAMEHASECGGFVFQMELDCVPLATGWVDALDRVVARSAGAWVVGGMYNGDFRVNNSIRLHMNGNALYNVGDAAFMKFVNETWMPRLLELSKDYPNLAYDCWWALEIEHSDTKDLSRSSSWNLLRSYASFFRPDPFILNYLNSDPLRTLFTRHYQFFSDLGKPPLFLHHASAVSLVKRVVAGEAQRVSDLLLLQAEVAA